MCWGGAGTPGHTTEELVPVPIAGLASEVTQIAIANASACAVSSDGAVHCWGSNFQGKLGDGTTTDSAEPVEVQGLSGAARSVALGFSHACALIEGGNVECWGDNGQGQLGSSGGSTTVSLTPVQVEGLTGDVAALVGEGALSTCALMKDGQLLCWGQLLGQHRSSPAPAPIPSL